VCLLAPDEKDLVERSLRGEPQADGLYVNSVNVAGIVGLTPTTVSRHKTQCMGLIGRQGVESLPVVDASALLPYFPPKERAELVPWVPQVVREEARSRLLMRCRTLEDQIDATPTAAMYAVLLEYLREIIKESEKAGGALENQAKNYLEEVQSKRREVTRTVTQTIKEVVTEVADKPEPVSAETAVFSEASSV
jgi:hypothetical protein